MSDLKKDGDKLPGEFSSIPLGTIHNGLQQLRNMKARGIALNKIDLDWEIRFYEWIIEQPDSDKKADLYLNMRHSNKHYLLTKREVVKQLGWEVI